MPILLQDVEPANTHVDFCDPYCFCVIDWLEMYALASIAVKSGEAIIAKATATAVNAKTDFVFIVNFLSTKGKINLILTLNPNNTEKNLENMY